MIVVPQELTERDIHQMTREQLIEALLGHTNYFSVRLTAVGLEQYSIDELRRLLFEVQAQSGQEGLRHKEERMVPTQATRNRSKELAQAIERQIEQRTWGRIHRLEVEVIDDRVVVHGYTQSYYSKQLALEGVLDVIGNSPHVELDVQVGPRPPNTTQCRAYPQGRRPCAAGNTWPQGRKE